MKTFITFSPQQVRLSAFHYEVQDNPLLEYGATCFPIIPAINGYAAPGEPFRVVLIVQQQDDCIRNAVAFREELKNLCAEKGLVCQELRELSVSFNNNVSDQLDTFQALIAAIEDGDDIHACVTYGSKPASLAELMALRYIRQFKKDTYISCIVYGEVNFRAGTAKIYDETALIHLDEIIRVLARTGTANPGKVLKSIIGM